MKKVQEAITKEHWKKKEKRFLEIRNIIEWLEDKVGKISHKVKKKRNRTEKLEGHFIQSSE